MHADQQSETCPARSWDFARALPGDGHSVYHISRHSSQAGEGGDMKCDEGYACEVCGRDVESIVDSDLYLRYVLSEVPLERLHVQRERHIRCNPSLAQFIVDERFEPVACKGPF